MKSACRYVLALHFNPFPPHSRHEQGPVLFGLIEQISGLHLFMWLEDPNLRENWTGCKLNRETPFPHSSVSVGRSFPGTLPVLQQGRLEDDLPPSVPAHMCALPFIYAWNNKQMLPIISYPGRDHSGTSLIVTTGAHCSQRGCCWADCTTHRLGV